MKKQKLSFHPAPKRLSDGEAFFFSPEVKIIAYVTVPKDLTKMKSKMLFGLTKRQLVCFESAALVGVPLFFLSKGSMGTTSAALCMIFVRKHPAGRSG